MNSGKMQKWFLNRRGELGPSIIVKIVITMFVFVATILLITTITKGSSSSAEPLMNRFIDYVKSKFW